MTDRYGGFDLQHGDRDDARTYGGQRRTTKTSGPGATNQATTVNTVVAPGYVRQLQKDLRELGFALQGVPSGTFDEETEWAVREFQIYAGMEYVLQDTLSGKARHYENLAGPISNNDRYDGPVSGVVNAKTRQTLAVWLRHRWRCPVVVECHQLDAQHRPAGLVAGNSNIWRYDDATPGHRCVIDWSNYYTRHLPPQSNSPEHHSLLAENPLGAFTNEGGYTGPLTRPPSDSWLEAEVLPETLIGVPLVRLSAAQRSTFKVLRAIADVECYGFLDCINAYDRGWMSVGLFHWTLRSELGGFLAAFQGRYPADYDAACGRFGLLPGVQFRRGANWRAAPVLVTGEDGTGQPFSSHDALRSWHWVYRWQMAARVIPGFQRCNYDMGRDRIFRIRRLAIGPDSAPGVPPATTLGDIFTSERAVAVLLRWHVNLPAKVLPLAKAAIAEAQAAHRSLRWGLPVAQWTDDEERALAEALLDVGSSSQAPPTYRQTTSRTYYFPTWAPPAPNPSGFRLDPAIGRLSVIRDSFLFDSNAFDLPLGGP